MILLGAMPRTRAVYIPSLPFMLYYISNVTVTSHDMVTHLKTLPLAHLHTDLGGQCNTLSTYGITVLCIELDSCQFFDKHEQI